MVERVTRDEKMLLELWRTLTEACRSRAYWLLVDMIGRGLLYRTRKAESEYWAKRRLEETAGDR